MRKPRGWVRRATLSALAGGGLTAASLSGPLTGGALGAGTGNTGPVPGSAEGSAVPSVASESPSPSRPREATTTVSTPSPAASPPPASTPQAGTPQSSGTPEAPAVVVQRRQRTTATSKNANPNLTATQAHPKAQPATVFAQHSQKITAGAGSEVPARHAQPAKGSKKTVQGPAKPPNPTASGPNNVALAPQVVAAEAGALAAELAGSAASAQALAFYRIPLFLLPIYQAAAVQYGVPWQILAAINEIETNYGVDQSVSSAGAVGWMQFMPATWMQYGVDALNAGYADPYNPVDAVFAAARYLRAAGAGSDLHGAILAYNHSEEYVSSVLLRAKLISTYPKPVIATLTGLIDDRLPVSGKQLAWGALSSEPSSSSATANATAVKGSPQSAPSAPPSPSAAAALAAGQASLTAAPTQFVDLMSAPNAAAVAVQDGRIVRLGSSRALGRYVILRDVYGDLFTYAGLGSIAPTYRLPKQHPAPAVKAPLAAGAHDPAPSQPASAGRPGPLTLRVQTPTPQSAPTLLSVPTGESTPSGMGKLRLFAHPGNPDALAARALAAKRRKAPLNPDRPLALRAGSVVAKGTILGHVRTPLGRQERPPALRDPPRARSEHDRPPPDPEELGAARHRASPEGRPRGNGAARRDRKRRLLVLKEPAAARCPLGPGHRDGRLRAAGSRLRGDRQARSGAARVPLAQLSEADRGHAALLRRRL